MMRQLLLLLIRGYRYGISPFMTGHCRHFPTCSEYAQQAIQHHGALRGGLLGLRRLGRCHPWGSWGYDPVPEPRSSSHAGDSPISNKGC
ncbi:hypothetical protein C8D92_103154 [Tamilnaduibacter salinus]|uniref:Putative membrane protein insertion efficiency factor n=1 Tax=Tamilnaduibacter salinus TaxID=1484056 RepID=A0A2U1CY98_9GAMM|nr:hypothetical protein C8D92_103154 [Tamilnaduibacter salinus]